MLTASSRSRQNWFTTICRMRTFTCFITRQSFAYWTWLSMRRTSAFMRIIGRTIGGIRLCTLMSLFRVLTGRPKRWFMTTWLGVRTELGVICVMGGRSCPIIRCITRPISVRISSVGEGHVPIITQRKKGELLTRRWLRNASNSYPRIESLKVYSKTVHSKQGSFRNQNLKRCVRWFTRSKRWQTAEQMFQKRSLVRRNWPIRGR